MQVQEEQHDHMQIVKFKGKRTKRQRLPSPLRLAMNEDLLSYFGVSHPDEHERSAIENSGGLDVAITSSPIASMDQFMNRTEEEEDMANCLILLAQGHHNTQKPSHHVVAPDQENNNNKKVGLIGSVGFRSRNLEPENQTNLYLYQCKTCNRCFPSFQALGGHRASHKKANTAQEKQAVTNFVNDNDHDHYHDPTTTSTALTLQISSNRALFGTSTRTSTNTKCKVHECSICGAEFTSGQALGGHMRRHRSILSTTSTTSSVNRANNIGGGSENIESLEAKRPRNVLKLDLNLPAPHEDDHRESKLPFQSKEKVIVFSATNSLVDCHY